MGMTIEEAQTALRKERKYALHENKQAFNIAIDTMCKYQKIERYMEKLEKNGQYGTLRKLKIVLGEAE